MHPVPMLMRFPVVLVCFVATALAIGCDGSIEPVASASSTARADGGLVLEPTTLDMGDLVPGVPVVKRVKLTNTTSKPMTVTNAVADCSCTTPTWPSEPIAPGETVETDITINAGPKQGVTLTKRVTFLLEGGELAFLSVVGRVGLFIELSSDLIKAPADDVAAPETTVLTLRGADGKPFRITSIDPAIGAADSAEASLDHTVTIDWLKWRELKKSTKLTILTDHPVTPEMLVAIRRTVSSTPAPTAPPTTAQSEAAPKPVIPPYTSTLQKRVRQYRITEPGVYPGASIRFPPLGAFVKGEETRDFAPGRVVVLEFFSTTCGHCKEAAPTVEALVREYQPKGWTFISVTAEDEQKVRDYFADPEHAELYPQAVAIDTDSRAQRALQDPTFRVLNPRFFVLRDGVVLWYGHPDIAEEPFRRIADGTWDPSSVRAEFRTDSIAARARTQSNNLLKQCEKDGKWEDLLTLFEAIAMAIPERASTFELQRFGTMIGPANMPIEGYQYGLALARHYATDLSVLRTIARTTLNSPRVQVRDLDFAFAVARAADVLAKGQDPRAAEVLALAYFSRGDRDLALEHIERAINLETDAKLKARYQVSLNKYRTQEPGPVPYTPPPGTNPATAQPSAPPAHPAGDDDE